MWRDAHLFCFHSFGHTPNNFHTYGHTPNNLFVTDMWRVGHLPFWETLLQLSCVAKSLVSVALWEMFFLVLTLVNVYIRIICGFSETRLEAWEWSSLLCNSQFSGYFAQVCTQHLKLWDITWAPKINIIKNDTTNNMIKKQCSSTRSIVEKVQINFKFNLLYLPSGEDRPSDHRRDTVDWRKPPENNLWKQSLQWVSKKLHSTWKQFAPNVKKSVLCSLVFVSWVWQYTRLHLHCWGKLL